MISADLLSPQLAADGSVHEEVEQERNGGRDDGQAVVRLRGALSDYLEAVGSEERWARFRTVRGEACATIAQLPRKETTATVVHEVRKLLKEVSASGVHDRVVVAGDLAQAQTAAAKGWPGLLAAMLLVPAWQWPDSPLVVAVPEWLRSDYVAWLFAPPLGFTAPGQADQYAAYSLGRMEELERWVKRRPGLAVEAEVLGVFAKYFSSLPLYQSDGDLCRQAELRGRLLARAFRAPEDHFEAMPTARWDRRLRVGFVMRGFGPQVDTYAILPTFEHLDPERFEIILIDHQTDHSTLRDYCRQRAAEYLVLPGDLRDQLSMLRTAALDVVVFGPNITDTCHVVARLALHRVAPLQVITSPSVITSGLPEIDLYVSGKLTATDGAAAQFSERLGLLPGPAQTFNFGVDSQETNATCTRAGFGLPDDALVFVSAANFLEITPEMQRTWARLLAEVPGSRLLVQPCRFDETAPALLERLRAEFGQVLAAQGVEAARLVVSAEYLASRSDLKVLLGLGDVYLDTFPVGRVDALVDALELGLPVVGREGEMLRSRTGGALLRALDRPELIATNEAEYRTIAAKLASDPKHRQELCAGIRAQMERTPIFLDALAASDAFGDLIETAYDELVEVGAEVFRANPEPVHAGRPQAERTGTAAADSAEQAREVLRCEPANLAARHTLGRELIGAGRPDRAVTYLLAALQGEEKNAGLWLDLATAFRTAGQTSQAIQALEAGLRIDDTLLEGWQMLADLAGEAGATDLAYEASRVAAQLAADKAI